MVAALLKGLVLGLMLSISVGPVIFTILKQSINNGHKGGFAFIAGVSASDITLVIISNLFTVLFEGLLQYKVAIGVGGSMLLIAMGLYITFLKKVKTDQAGVQIILVNRRDMAKIFLSGYFMNILNPAVIGFWLLTSTSLLTQTHQYRFIVFVTCLALVVLLDVAKVMLAGRIRSKLTSHNIHIINRIAGLILIGFGIVLIWGILAYGNQLN